MISHHEMCSYYIFFTFGFQMSCAWTVFGNLYGHIPVYMNLFYSRKHSFHSKLSKDYLLKNLFWLCHAHSNLLQTWHRWNELILTSASAFQSQSKPSISPPWQDFQESASTNQRATVLGQFPPRLVTVFSRVMYVPPILGSLILALKAIIATNIEYRVIFRGIKWKHLFNLIKWK